jgi:hypothetical protein
MPSKFKKPNGISVNTNPTFVGIEALVVVLTLPQHLFPANGS